MPREKTKFIAAALVAPTQVPEVSPGIVIEIDVQVFAVGIE